MPSEKLTSVSSVKKQRSSENGNDVNMTVPGRINLHVNQMLDDLNEDKQSLSTRTEIAALIAYFLIRKRIQRRIKMEMRH